MVGQSVHLYGNQLKAENISTDCGPCPCAPRFMGMFFESQAALCTGKSTSFWPTCPAASSAHVCCLTAVLSAASSVLLLLLGTPTGRINREGAGLDPRTVIIVAMGLSLKTLIMLLIQLQWPWDSFLHHIGPECPQNKERIFVPRLILHRKYSLGCFLRNFH